MHVWCCSRRRCSQPLEVQLKVGLVLRLLVTLAWGAAGSLLMHYYELQRRRHEGIPDDRNTSSLLWFLGLYAGAGSDDFPHSCCSRVSEAVVQAPCWADVP